MSKESRVRTVKDGNAAPDATVSVEGIPLMANCEKNEVTSMERVVAKDDAPIWATNRMT